jgi:murein endopeptidase
VRATLRVVRAYAAAHPGAPRVGIGDLSRRHGGDFGRAFGTIGHATHQNGLDVDVYYPLRSGAERAPLSVDEINQPLAQDLVDRFVRAGAVKVYVGPSTGLTGPAGVVEAIPLHDNHLHARLPG